MKHLKHFFVVLLLLCSAAANASNIFVDGIYYNILSSEEGTVEVTGVSYREYSGNIVIPESFKVNNKVLKVVGIGDRAFSGCYELISVKIPNGVTYIGDEAFRDCSGLASVDFGSNVSSIGESAFYGCSSLKSVEIPGKVTSIDKYTFHSCSALASVSIPGSVTDISGSAFSGCISLKYVTLEDGTEPLYTGHNSTSCLFSNCPLDSVYIGREHSYSGIYSPFYNNSSLRAVRMGENVTKIGGREFSGCKNLSSVTISESVDSIGTSAFYNCDSLKSITIPDGVTYIGNSAFCSCSGLASVDFGSNVSSIGEYAFMGCSSLKSVEIPGKVTSIDKYTFDNCSALESVSIPGSVTKIHEYAFTSCSSLKYVTIEDSSESLYMGANASNTVFNNCPLDSVYIGRELSYSGSSSPFYGNSSLRAVTMGEHVTKIGEREFNGCKNLSSVTISESVDSIGTYAFYGCKNVSELICHAKTPPVCGEKALDGINKKNCILWVPELHIAKYQSANQWKDFYSIKGIPAEMYTVTYIVDDEVYATDSVAYGSEIVLRDEPTKEGHTFSGWSEAPETMPAEDITITGSFEVNTYAVTYIVDDEVYATDSVAYGSEIVLRDEPVKEGHTFSGWSGVPETMPAEDITITGSFAVNTYAVTYIVDGEVYATDSIAYGSEIVLRDEPVKEGHTFSGWSEVPETMPAEDIAIEGTFSVNSYAITYKVDGEVYATDSIAYGSEIVLRDEPAKEGHTFSGWSEVPETMPANDITIEGTFSINSYTVTFMIDGEVYETATVEFGAEIELPTPPEKEGYIFSGWVGVPDTMPAEDIVIEGEYIVDTTGINDVKAENGKVKGVYDLQGRKVDNATNGIYIINGKKTLIK